MQLGIEILKRRTLQLQSKLTAAESGKAVCVLCEIIGVRGVQIEGDKLHLTYDLAQVTPEAIQESIAAAGAELGDELKESLHLAFASCEDNDVRKSAAGNCSSCG